MVFEYLIFEKKNLHVLSLQSLPKSCKEQRYKLTKEIMDKVSVPLSHARLFRRKITTQEQHCANLYFFVHFKLSHIPLGDGSDHVMTFVLKRITG